MLENALRFLSLSDANVRFVLFGSMLIGCTGGLLGSFTVLRRRSLVGEIVELSGPLGSIGARKRSDYDTMTATQSSSNSQRVMKVRTRKRGAYFTLRSPMR